MGFVQQMDESYKLLTEFLKNTHRSAGFGNIYVARAVDKNGKTVDVKFGKNIFTDNGMARYFISNEDFPNKFFIGFGGYDIGITYTDTELIDPYDTEATLISATRNYAYPMYFDGGEGRSHLITVVCRALQVKFPLTITGLPDAISISEYGIGTSRTSLWTHSWVYDTLGRPAVIIKYPEQELYIDVYFCMSYQESMILDNWTNHRYTMITTMEAFFQGDKRMGGTIYTFRRGNMKTARTSTTTTSNFQNNVITKYINLDSFVMYRQLSETDGYMDGFLFWSNGFVTAERELLTTSEAIDEIIIPQGFKDTCISDKFGNYDAESIPITQCNVSHSYLYNPTSHAWDITESFINDPNKWYTETLLQRTCATPLYYTNNNSIMQLYLYQNINTSDPILSFDNNMETVYACEKYWDKTTWHHITNLLRVPDVDTNEYGHTLNCQTARYYTTSLSSENISLTPHRQSEGFVIIPTGGRSVEYPFIKSGYTWKEVNGSEQYHWYKYGNNIYFPDYPATYTFSEVNDTGYSFACGKYLVEFITTNDVIYYDMSDPTTAPTAQTLNLPFGNRSINLASAVYRSDNGRGLITVQAKSYDISYVLDFNQSTPTATEYQTKKMCAVWGEDRIAYIPADDTSHIKVYEFGTTNAVIQTMDVPTGYNPAILFGHTNYVWMTSSTSTVDSHCYDITTGVDTSIVPITDLSNTSVETICMTAVDDCFIIYKRTQANYINNYWFRLTEPTVVHDLNGLSTTAGQNTGVQYFLNKVHGGAIALLRVNVRNNGNTQNAISIVCDFGNWMDGNTQYVYLSPASTADDAIAPLIPYGGYLISNNNIKYPLEHWMPHRVIGTTNTIGTVNHIVNIRNKQYYTTFSNVGDFVGLPPGVKQ